MSGVPTISERAEINVTPLIDVLLVLLIVFMVITPLAPRGLAAAVPHDATGHVRPDGLPIVLEVSATGDLQLNGRPLPAVDLKVVLARLYLLRADKVLFMKAAKDLEYRKIAELIDQVRGVNQSIQIALIP